jgi:ADP-ribose pyrophosphatase YjhB (NUDIX family)
MQSSQLLAYAQRLQSIAQAGLTYAANAYDVERYSEIRDLSVKFLQELTDEPFEKIVRVFAYETGYQTPKVDIRAVLFRGKNEILLVKEKIDNNRWTLPGGWADIGYTPSEVAVKEVKEEAGLDAKAVRLLALLDKREHGHPPEPWYVYKIFIRCEVVGGELIHDTTETGGAQWFGKEEALKLDLSTARVTADQLKLLFPFATNPDLPVICD